MKIKVNPNAAKELAKQIEKNLKKQGINAKLDQKDVREMQREINKFGKIGR